MSRNYFEYQTSETIKPRTENKKADTIVKDVNQDEFNYIGI